MDEWLRKIGTLLAPVDGLEKMGTLLHDLEKMGTIWAPAESSQHFGTTNAGWPTKTCHPTHPASIFHVHMLAGARFQHDC